MFQLQKRQVEETVQSAGCRALGESLSGRLKIFRVTRGKKYLGKNQKTLGLVWLQHYELVLSGGFIPGFNLGPNPDLIFLQCGTGSGRFWCNLGYEMIQMPQQEALAHCGMCPSASNITELVRGHVRGLAMHLEFKVWFLKLFYFFFDSRCTLQNSQIWKLLSLITTFELKFCQWEWASTILNI